jgi:dephospho-CoA kinase
MDGHLTAGRSTVVQEAAELGVPSVACDPEAADFYAAEIAQGALRIASTGGEILAALEAAMAAPLPARIGARPDPQAAMDTLLGGFGRGERGS